MSASNKLNRAINNSIGRAVRKVNSAVTTGSIRALNRAVESTRTKANKLIRDETGLTRAEVEKRLFTRKSSKDKLNGSLNIAVKVGIPLDKFSPKEQKIRTVPNLTTRGKRRVGRPKARTYFGVSIKMGKRPRELVPGGFYRQIRKGKEMVLARKYSLNDKGEYINRKAPRLPTVRLRRNVVREVALQNRVALRDYLSETFHKNLASQIDYAIKSK